MKEICIFNYKSKAAIYGIGTYIKEYVNCLKGTDYKVNLVELGTDNTAIDVYFKEEENIRTIYIPNQDGGTFDKYSKSVCRLLRLYIEDSENLVFHFHYAQSDSLLEYVKKYFPLSKSVCTIHYFSVDNLLRGNISLLKKIIDEQENEQIKEKYPHIIENYNREKTYWGKITHIICLSGYMREILYKDYRIEAGKVSVIPNGLTDRFERSQNKKHLRKKWNVAVREKIILFAGRLDEIKGLGYLIKAFREALTVCPQIRLVVAGDGGLKKYLGESSEIYTKITFTGFLDKSQLYEWYRIADVGITPSLYETFGYVAVEMMMHELPVVATATSGLNEIVDDTCGLKMPVTELPDRVEIDVALLSQKIIYLLQHPSEARKMGRNGRKRFLREYSSEVFRRNILNFYTSVFGF